ncbi:2'-5' RNA ligase family protein [Frigoribacterium faeni]|uniref:2'-5' RNA ligase n=1 Tax=Frigoribacterium faeni TaxID=145483 RepID=A0A7W3JG18_9MICO|nr:2'-5' RNA ligase family protein [Frigoribacterium faeni]MBA8812138.1 2'-5' RNA ligase [Frigoribacterium faeni]BFF13161.1 2'-5' RNA ligase family protein [Microbacterium flavescens]GEK83875.1 hypothetical protein FFA01_21840 [Frigoribacterium faeni]
MHSIELLLDDASDAAVRDDWRLLAEAGLPSLAGHTGATNAPHLTLSAAARFDDRADPRLLDVFSRLPVSVEWGGFVVFGRGPRGLVLARGVVATSALLDLHRTVHESVGGAGPVEHSAPGRWTPHVTLASRLSPEQLGRALEVLSESEVDGATARLTSARRWDGDARVVVPLGGPTPPG